MSTDNPGRRIDWNGEGQDQESVPVLKSRSLLRKSAVPVAIGFAGLALVGALAAGPLMRGTTGADAETAAVAETVRTTALVQPAAAQQPAAAAETPPAAAAAEPAAVPAPEPAAPTATTRVEGSAGLAADDPRWNPTALPVDEAKLAALKAAVDETVAAAEIATAMGNTGGLVTSGIPSSAAGFAPERPSAPRPERSAFDAALVTADEEVEAEPAVAANLSPAKATQYVNMRAAPDDDATVLAVVPANAAIEAETDCRWCEVSYKGQKGYVFQSFIAR